MTAEDRHDEHTQHSAVVRWERPLEDGKGAELVRRAASGMAEVRSRGTSALRRAADGVVGYVRQRPDTVVTTAALIAAAARIVSDTRGGDPKLPDLRARSQLGGQPGTGRIVEQSAEWTHRSWLREGTTGSGYAERVDVVRSAVRVVQRVPQRDS